MMDIFAHAGKHERVEELYYRFPPRTKSANILIKAYGRDNLPERATTFLKENMLLQNDESTNSLAPNPDRFTFTAVIDCWVRSSVKIVFQSKIGFAHSVLMDFYLVFLTGRVRQA
jgi:hypothetical protein